MSKETRYPVIICIILTIIAVIGIILGIWMKKPVIIAWVLLPAAIYESVRTEGVFTRLASWGSLVIVAIEIYVVITGTNIDLSKYFTQLKSLPLFGGQIHAGLIGPVVLVILALYLLRRTAGIYTRWLSVIILITSIALFYSINPEMLQDLLKSKDIQDNVKRGIERRVRGI